MKKEAFNNHNRRNQMCLGSPKDEEGLPKINRKTYFRANSDSFENKSALQTEMATMSIRL